MPTPEPPSGRFVLTPEQRERAHDAFVHALDSSTLAYDVGQLGLFHEEDETYIRREVERMLYDQKLPNGGDRERRMIERLKEYGNSMAPEWQHHGRLKRALEQWNLVLPANKGNWVGGAFIANAGRYYTRKPLTPKQDKTFFDEMITMLRYAREEKDFNKKWFAQMMLDGNPEAVSDFDMECLFLLRKSDGSVLRLVRLRNTVGETSRGEHHEGAVILDEDAFASPEKYRKWCLKWGNFNWSGNQTDLHLHQEDIGRLSAHKVINQVDSVGWLEVKPETRKQKTEAGPKSDIRTGIWFSGDCAYADGKPLPMDDDGIYWWQGEGYYLNRRGREANFEQGKPKLTPDWRLVKGGTVIDGVAPEWSITHGRSPATAEAELTAMRELYQDLCQKFYDTVGSYEGWMGMGAMFAFAAGPELYARLGYFPGLWVHGQMGSGKTTYVEWLMHLWGYQISAGIGLRTGTAVGIQQQCENYSNHPLWLDQYSQGKVKEDKEGVMEDAFNRQPSVKWTKDGIMREMKTMFVVSGESTPSLAALRSRYSFAQVSRAKRLQNHLIWMQENKNKFFVFGRLLMERREEFAKLLMNQLDAWLRIPEMAGMSERDKTVNGVSIAAWQAMSGLLESHSAEDLRKFREFTVAHTQLSSSDVTSETNINVFLQDLMTTFNSEDGLPHNCFHLEETLVDHPPDWPNQTGYLTESGQRCMGWLNYRVYLDPDQIISEVNIRLRKSGGALALRRKDLQAQLSKINAWIDSNPLKPFGDPGAKRWKRCWGFDLDKLEEMGRLECTDEGWQHYMESGGHEGDPRKGPFYSIVAGLNRKKNLLEDSTR